ncbi:hypothetical protein AB3X91_33760 [Paraburkholderia sp. BR14263]|uniref:hypothetical protein n=1 Tax=unclassified Paraburkholderia TaxID=2615204 RepID=UPI0034CDB921
MIGDAREMISSVLNSEQYLQELKTIHAYHQNVKNESRYRDAFIRVFKDAFGKQGFMAYAEVDKVDLVIINLETDKRCHVEFKYQYTFDMYAETGRIEKNFDRVCARAKEKKGGVAERIVADCMKCDFFILIVKDRAGHPQQGMLPGGVAACCIEDQRYLDRIVESRPDEAGSAWLSPTVDLLRKASDRFGGTLVEQPIKLMVSESVEAPLTSYIFLLDRTDMRR